VAALVTLDEDGPLGKAGDRVWVDSPADAGQKPAAQAPAKKTAAKKQAASKPSKG
jgi:hypothetical protein